MKRSLSLIFFILTASVIQFFLSSCAYKLSTKLEKLPGDVKSIQVPLFINSSTEPGIEVFFTNSLKNETLKSRVVKLVNDESESDGILQGRIADVDVLASDSIIDAKREARSFTGAETLGKHKIIRRRELRCRSSTRQTIFTIFQQSGKLWTQFQKR